MQKVWYVHRRVILSIVSLIVGIVIYYLFYKHLISKDSFLFIFIRNYLLDSLWAVSFFFASIIFFRNIAKKYLILTSLFVFVNGIVFELMQLEGIANGTFDFADIITYMFAVLIACLIEKLMEVKYGKN